MTFRILSEAQEEADTAAAWYDQKRLGLGDQFLTELEQALDRISARASDFPIGDFYTGPEELRRCTIHRFPYSVFFLRRPDEVVVVAVSHGRRRPLHWADRIRPQQD